MPKSLLVTLTRSPLMQGRGLKRLRADFFDFRGGSPLMQGRGLKLARWDCGQRATGSSLMQGRGLKLRWSL